MQELPPRMAITRSWPACSATLAMHTACQDSGEPPGSTWGPISGGTGRNVVADRAVLQLETRGETTEIERTVFGGP